MYAALLNDVGTIITGQIGVDQRLAERLATSDTDAKAVAARLRDLLRGDWLVSPAAPFAEHHPHPFHVASPPLPAGHPDGSEPLAGDNQYDFERAFQSAKARTRDNHGTEIGRAASGSTEPAAVWTSDLCRHSLTVSSSRSGSTSTSGGWANWIRTDSASRCSRY